MPVFPAPTVAPGRGNPAAPAASRLPVPVFPASTVAPGRDSPAAGAVSRLPVPVGQRGGPVLRKMTGDEDMSWLNINAGRPM